MHRATSVVAVAAALAVGHLITSSFDLGGIENPPFVRDASRGDVAHLSYADVEVTDVRPAAYLSTGISTDLARKADDVWVLVSVEATATREPVLIHQGWLVDPQGRAYLTSARSGCTQNPQLYTGVPVYTLFCFELPAGRLAGLHFRLARGDMTSDETRGDDLADIDLDVSAATAKAWSGTTASYLAQQSGVQPVELATVDLTETSS